MRAMVVGSHALQKLGVCNRVPKDLDLWTDTQPDPEIEEKVDLFWHPLLAEIVPEAPKWVHPSLDLMYTVKLSHSHWDLKNGSWGKHIADLIRLQKAGAKLLEPEYKILYKVWEETHGKKVMNLDQDKTEFFDDAVRRKYDHDSIHESVAFGDRPIYEDILRDGATVDVDPRKLWSLPHSRLVQLFTEEVCVTALERIVIPRNYKVSPGFAYQWALRRTITSLTKGKSSRFMLENIQEFIKPDPDYVKRHLRNKERLVEL